MEQNKQFPLSKPPKIPIEKIATPIAATPLVTQQRMEVLNRYSKVFFIFGLLALAFGLFTWIELNRTTEQLAKYEAAFELFPELPSLIVENTTQQNIEITDFSVYELSINKEDSQSIFYKNIAEDIKNSSESKIIIRPETTREFNFLPKELDNNEVKGKKMFYHIAGWIQEKKQPIYEFKHVPEKGLIKLVTTKE